jgi:hypothetical protein
MLVEPITGPEGPERGGWSAPRPGRFTPAALPRPLYPGRFTPVALPRSLYPGRFTPGKDPVPIVQEAGWAPGPVRTCAENIAPQGFDPWTVQLLASRYID